MQPGEVVADECIDSHFACHLSVHSLDWMLRAYPTRADGNRSFHPSMVALTANTVAPRDLDSLGHEVGWNNLVKLDRSYQRERTE